MNLSSAQKRISFGYNRKDNTIILNEGQAAAVELIFTFYNEGRSIAEIKDALESYNIPSPQNKPTWGKQTIANILSNPHYLGTDEYPPIIDKELFDAVQEHKTRLAQHFAHK